MDVTLAWPENLKPTPFLCGLASLFILVSIAYMAGGIKLTESQANRMGGNARMNLSGGEGREGKPFLPVPGTTLNLIRNRSRRPNNNKAQCVVNGHE